MLRNEIRAEVAAIDPVDAIERGHIEDALAWIDSGAPLCRVAKPATPPKYLVSYFAVVDDSHVLLVDHKKAQLWLPTGGHVEPGEHPRTTVQRELQEELGFTLLHELDPPIMVTCTDTVGMTAGHTDVSLWYAVRGDRSQPIVHDTSEFNTARWFAFAEAPIHRSDPHLGRFLGKLALATHRGGRS